MKKILTLAEVKAIYGDAVFETETAFGVNVFGKYKPNVTFIVTKEFGLGRNGEPVDPMEYVSDREVTDNMNIGWGGSAEFIFGDYWVSRKGGACFRPQNPMFAKHLLVCVSWGGCFNPTRGASKEYADGIGALYFRSASSNGFGSGNDYWVLPVGFTNIRKDDEIDGDAPVTDRSKLFAERAKAYREKHASIFAETAKANDLSLREKVAAETESRQLRCNFLLRMEAVKTKVDALCERGIHMEEVTIGDVYFKHSLSSYLYTEENVSRFESLATCWQQQVEKLEAEKVTAAQYQSKIAETYGPRLKEIGWELAFKSDEFRVPGSNAEIPYSEAGLKVLDTLIDAQEAKITKEKAVAKVEAEYKTAKAEAKALGLPSDVRIWYRSGATNAGSGWVIMSNGMERDYDEIKNPRPRYRDEGYGIWHQILPGEVVLSWKHAFTAAVHEFEVIYRPNALTEAQRERIAEIQNGLEDEFLGKVGLTGTRCCPSIGNGWNLR